MSPRKFSACGPSGRKIDLRESAAGGGADMRRFENNQEMIRNYLPGVPYCYTSGSPYNEGDGITMAMSVGADLWHMNNYAGPRWR